MLLYQWPGFKIWAGHLHAYGFGFIATRYDTTIVVAEHHHGLIFQIRSEQSFAGAIKAVTVYDGFETFPDRNIIFRVCMGNTCWNRPISHTQK